MGSRCHVRLLSPKVSTLKDKRKFLITQESIGLTKDLTSINQEKRIVSAYQKLVAINSACKEQGLSLT